MTSHYIERAIHALNTGQPNLATLYMGRARARNFEERLVNVTEWIGARA